MWRYLATSGKKAAHLSFPSRHSAGRESRFTTALQVRMAGYWEIWLPYHQPIVTHCQAHQLAPHHQSTQPAGRAYRIRSIDGQRDDPYLEVLEVPKRFRGDLWITFRHSYSGCGYLDPIEQYLIRFFGEEFDENERGRKEMKEKLPVIYHQ